MTERELNILKEKYNRFMGFQLTIFPGKKLILGTETLRAKTELLRDVFKWLDLTAEFDNNGLVTYLGNGKEYSDNDRLIRKENEQKV